MGTKVKRGRREAKDEEWGEVVEMRWRQYQKDYFVANYKSRIYDGQCGLKVLHVYWAREHHIAYNVNTENQNLPFVLQPSTHLWCLMHAAGENVRVYSRHGANNSRLFDLVRSENLLINDEMEACVTKVKVYLTFKDDHIGYTG